MKTTKMKSWMALLLMMMLCSTSALAARDTFELGDGHDGPLLVNGKESKIISSYARVDKELKGGDKTIPIASLLRDPESRFDFEKGRLILVLQTTGTAGVPVSTAGNIINLSTTSVGTWELARVESVNDNTLTLKEPLIHDYHQGVTQVITVPEFSSVTVMPAGRIEARTWDHVARTGGVVAFLATGVVTLEQGGSIRANFSGFSGGASSQILSDATTCQGAGAWPGEGVNVGMPSTPDRANAANGGGGGECFGAGGGGNGGAGGRGGAVSPQQQYGQGGVGFGDPRFERLTLGGGGGGGDGVVGGRGGGIIFVRAKRLSGQGAISAVGEAGGTSNSGGGAGGGAGGTIYLRVAESASCGSLDVHGGVGGGTNSSDYGPGGGGGGGRLVFQAKDGSCFGGAEDNVRLYGGQSGTRNGGKTDGESPGQEGLDDPLAGGFWRPNAPDVNAPSDRASIPERRPTIGGKADPNVAVHIYVDGQDMGIKQSDSAGNWSLPLDADLDTGEHEVYAVAEFQDVWSDPSAENHFTIVSDLFDFQGGGVVGCSAVGGNPGLLLAGVVLLAVLSQRKRS